MPDSIGVNGPIWSQRVVDLIESRGLSGYRAIELKLQPWTGLSIPPPSQRYYLIDFIGRVEVSREHFDANEGEACPVCGWWKPAKGGKFGRGDRTMAIRIDSTPLPDFAIGRNVQGPYYLCSREFVELVRVNSLTGFLFRPAARGLRRIDLKRPSWFEDFREDARRSYPDLLE